MPRFQKIVEKKERKNLPPEIYSPHLNDGGNRRNQSHLDFFLNSRQLVINADGARKYL